MNNWGQYLIILAAMFILVALSIIKYLVCQDSSEYEWLLWIMNQKNVDVWSEIAEAVGNQYAHLPGT